MERPLLLLLFLVFCVNCLQPNRLLPYFNDSIYPNDISEWKFDFSFLSNLPKNSPNVWNRLIEECREDLLFTLKAIDGNVQNETNVKNKFTMPLLDSWAKLPPPGVLRGNIRVPGMYLECVNINYYSQQMKKFIKGEYYRVLFDFRFQSHKNKGACVVRFVADLCLPKSCAKDDLKGLFQAVNPPICEVLSINSLVMKPDAGTWITGVLMVLVTVICVLASFVDYYLPEEKRKSMNKMTTKVLESLSFHRNVAEIFTIKFVNQQTGCLNCIRTISICWVMCGHVFSSSILVSSNSRDQLHYLTNEVFANFYANAYFSVDSFFFMSGFVLSLSFFKVLRAGKANISDPKTWIMFYVHRILRLSPPYYFAIFFYGFIVQPLLLNMPLLLTPEISDANSCRNNWWTNILYINNYVESDHMCYGPSWYLATDFQMYLLSPILLVIFALFGSLIGILASLACILIAAGLSVFFVLHYKLPPTGFPYKWPYKFNAHDYAFWIYDFPFVRMQPYVVGIALGYLLLQKKYIKINRVLNVILWIVSLGGMVGLVLAGYAWDSGHHVTLGSSAAYNALARLAWSLCLSWVVISCYYQQAGPIGSFMNWSIWIPLARMSYSAYLTHVSIMYLYWGMGTTQFQFRNGIQLFLQTCCPVFFFTFIFCIYWTSVFEKPFAKIESLLLVRPSSRNLEKSKKNDDLPQETEVAQPDTIKL